MRKDDYSTWMEKFEPLYDQGGPVRYETYSTDIDKVLETDMSYVWTVIEGDRNWYIVPGYHVVNRLFYFITKNPHNEKTRDYKY